MMNLGTQARCFVALLYMDLLAFRRVFFDRCINFFVWAVTTTTIAGYVFPQFGMDPLYGRFFFVGGVLASVGMFEAYGRIIELVADLSDDRPILYYGTLPITSFWLVIRMVVSNVIRFVVLGVCVFPLGKCILGSIFSFESIRWVEFICMYLSASVFYASCSVWLALQVRGVMNMSNVWTRMVFPVWFLGGVQFSHAALARAVPWLAVINMANPVMYITEGLRSAVLGVDGFVSVWSAIFVLGCMSSIAIWYSSFSFRKTLDLAI